MKATRRPWCRVVLALAPGWFCLVTAKAPGAPEPSPPRAEWLETADGRRVAGKVSGDAASGFRFEAEGGAAAVPLAVGSRVAFQGPAPDASAGLPPFHALLGNGQQVSGKLVTVDEAAVQLTDGPDRKPVRLERGGVGALIQRPGEIQVFQDGFEELKNSAWFPLGNPAEVSGDRRVEGERSLVIPAGPSSVSHRLSEPVDSGRLELAFYDSGEAVSGQRWNLGLSFLNPGDPNKPQPVHVIFGWSEASLGVDSPYGPTLAVQHLPRTRGWHRLLVRFNPERTDIAVDGNELAHGAGPAGPLYEILIFSEAIAPGKDREREKEKAPEKVPDDLAGAVDDLRLARLAEPVRGLELDPTQDEARLIAGDQIFGRLVRAGERELSMEVAGSPTRLPWTEVAGLYFRRAPRQGAPVRGVLARLAWQAAPGSDPHDLDQLEGALAAVTPTAFTLETPYCGTVVIPRDRLRQMMILGRGRRLVLDPTPHHLGNDVDRDLVPPQPEGGTLDVSFTLDAVPDGPATLVLDVVKAVGEAENVPFSDEVRRGHLRDKVRLNGREFDYLNRHVHGRNETSERVALTIPRGLLKAGPNRLRFEQTGLSTKPHDLDDLGLLGIAIEWDETDPNPDPGPSEAPRP